MKKNTNNQISQSGFTLMEIVVATAVFAVVVSSMLVLFTNTLKINRRVQGARQVSQGSRNFTEIIAREIRNGRIDYFSEDTNCVQDYSSEKNQNLALINKAGERLCFFLKEETLYLSKVSATSYITEKVNPPNFFVDQNTFRFIVKPATDPDATAGGSKPGIQPLVTIVAKFTYRGANGETPVSIPYQTSISTDVYDIPNAD